MVKTISAILLGVAVAAMTAGEPAYYSNDTRPGNYIKRVMVGPLEREYRLHVPVRYDGSRPFPVILVFHGSSASASVIERESSFNERADSMGFLVVYPEGLYRAWNIGECCRYSFKHHVDEVAFTQAILDKLEETFVVDSARVYATGYSDGGTLSYILGCTIPNRIAAVAGISGTLFEPEPRCALPRPVPAMVVHGTSDQRIPYLGEPGGPPEGHGQAFTHSAPEVAQFWVEHDRCRTPGDRVQSGHVVRVHYTCAAGSEVLFYTIVGGAHGWPGGGRGWIFSPVPPKDMIATDSVARFFLRHRLPAPRTRRE